MFSAFRLRTFRIRSEAVLLGSLGDVTVGKVTFTNPQQVVRAGLRPDHPRKANHLEKDKGENHRCGNASADHGAIAQNGREQSI